MDYTDFHCHLDSPDFKDHLDEIINRIKMAGVTTIVTVADPYESGSHEITATITEENRGYYMMTAAHPHNAKDYTGEVEKKIVTFAEHKKMIGIGEAGLDFYYNLSPPEVQEKVFRRQIGIAGELNLPLILHSRDAEQRILKILEETRFNMPVIFHCYTGNLTDAEEIITRGYFISISGIITFKKAEYLRAIAEMIPLDRIFYETDSPYLSPEPFRGRTNDPSRVTLVAERIAAIKGIQVPELNRAVKSNFDSVFR